MLYRTIVTIGLCAAGCAGSRPMHATSYTISIDAETITLTTEGEGLTESGTRLVYIKGADLHASSDGETRGGDDESMGSVGGTVSPTVSTEMELDNSDSESNVDTTTDTDTSVRGSSGARVGSEGSHGRGSMSGDTRDEQVTGGE